ncbi:hypothetical protein [Dyadobacter psychrotolerans]|uniref:DUF1792 domain-containing protein n=1 Tax=Dyadobacter psychrotolerans TaxID=2541721 RepID=A0A4R5DAD4_9BACT|nr:hypothetical protein [Dyadobacter psychrotolerans]TDE08404.1 hypothetical protein E0F88_32625 [Dyadobacter psychrotolerans]
MKVNISDIPLFKVFIKNLSRACKALLGPPRLEKLKREQDPNVISQNIINLLNSNKPIMIARYGATELSAIINSLGVSRGLSNIWDYIRGLEHDWWWDKSIMKHMEQWSGFFPTTSHNMERFCNMMIDDTKELDMLASWLDNEIYIKKELKNVTLFQGIFLDPFWSNVPWTKALTGKKILVIHPFESDIQKQYKKREHLFTNKDILPAFKLITIKAVQSIGGTSTFASWFDALAYMKSEIDNVDFDICLIGAGAYGFPLASYIKRKGKKAVHMGGSLQLLFGIKGKRWEAPLYGIDELGQEGKYAALMNDYWIYPSPENRPETADNVEGACYW